MFKGLQKMAINIITEKRVEPYGFAFKGEKQFLSV
jgi:hypothetical protein